MGRMITRECIERIKDSVDICDVVSPHVSLKRCGVNWRGLSPFNQEKTPSFFVMPSKKMFRCFSSGHAGDIFRFIQLKENVSFVDAVEMIANRFNIPLEFEKSSDVETRPYSRKSLFDMHAMASDFFVKNFHAAGAIGEKVRRYWTDVRKFSMDAAMENGIGFGGSSDGALLRKMLDAGFSQDAVRASGIFYFREGESSPMRGIMRFHSRLTIPIRDIQGRVVAFSARVVDGVTANDAVDAKYINSPETEIFRKGSLLFGLHRARQCIDRCGVFWLVEGQLDVLRCWDNGIDTAVAPQGTAIGDVQLCALRRYAARLNCLLDGDAPGLKAAERMLPMAIAAGLDVKFFILPDGNDPDGYFREDFSNRFDSLQKSAMTAIEFLVHRFLSGKKMTANERAEHLARIYEIIALSESVLVRESYLLELSVAANLDRHSLLQDFKSFSTGKKFSEPVAHFEANVGASPHKISSAESQLLAIALANKKMAKQMSKFIDEQFFQSLLSREGKILLKLLNEVREGMWDGMSMLCHSRSFADDEKNLMCAAFADFDDDCDPVNVTNACLRKIFSNFIKGEIEAVNEKIRKISLDEGNIMRNLQKNRLALRKKLGSPPQIC